MQNTSKIWADCFECKCYQEFDGVQGCNNYDLIGLPDNFRVGTTKKCCSDFSVDEVEYLIPDITKMEEGVLYFYNPDKPNNLIEDIDL